MIVSTDILEPQTLIIIWQIMSTATSFHKSCTMFTTMISKKYTCYVRQQKHWHQWEIVKFSWFEAICMTSVHTLFTYSCKLEKTKSMSLWNRKTVIWFKKNEFECTCNYWKNIFSYLLPSANKRLLLISVIIAAKKNIIANR